MRQNATRLSFPDHLIPHHINYHPRRRRISFLALPDGSIEIRAPHCATVKQLQKLLLEHQHQLPTPPPVLTTKRNELYYQGLLYDVSINLDENCNKANIRLQGDGILHLTVSTKQQIAIQMEHCLIENCIEIFRTRTAYFCGQLQVIVRHISIRDLKSRWGSCSPHNASIRYNWRLIMAPPEVLDYIVIHELSHLRVANHSAAFWELVAAHDPAYKEHRRWLRMNGNSLFLPLNIS